LTNADAIVALVGAGVGVGVGEGASTQALLCYSLDRMSLLCSSDGDPPL